MSPAAAPDADWLVACLCAAWCGTCTEYRAAFDAAARQHPEARFAWIDIEDHAAELRLLGDLQVVREKEMAAGLGIAYREDDTPLEPEQALPTHQTPAA